MEVVTRVKKLASELMNDDRYNGCTVYTLYRNTNATKWRYIIERSEQTVGFDGSIDYEEGQYKKLKDAMKAFVDMTSY